jgi:hypothetical protein
MTKHYRVYWASNDGNEMTREIGLVSAENENGAIGYCTGFTNPATEIEGEVFPDALYYAEEIVSAAQLEDLLSNMFWEGRYHITDSAREYILRAVIDRYNVTKL